MSSVSARLGRRCRLARSRSCAGKRIDGHGDRYDGRRIARRGRHGGARGDGTRLKASPTAAAPFACRPRRELRITAQLVRVPDGHAGQRPAAPRAGRPTSTCSSPPRRSRRPDSHGEAPLIDTSASTVVPTSTPSRCPSADQRPQWMDLALLAPGGPPQRVGRFVQNRQCYSQTNVDGRRSDDLSSTADSEQRSGPRSIGEFQVVANRFDATQGRSPAWS